MLPTTKREDLELHTLTNCHGKKSFNFQNRLEKAYTRKSTVTDKSLLLLFFFPSYNTKAASSHTEQVD